MTTKMHRIAVRTGMNAALAEARLGDEILSLLVARPDKTGAVVLWRDPAGAVRLASPFAAPLPRRLWAPAWALAVTSGRKIDGWEIGPRMMRGIVCPPADAA